MICAIITMFKNERHIINEWIDHHLSVGFDHIYLIDNVSSDGYNIDEQFKKAVTIHKMSGINQRDIYDYYLADVKKTSDWVAVIDLDEFIYTKAHSSIKNMLLSLPKHITRVDIQMKLFCVSSFNDPKSKIESQSHYIPDSVRHPKCISRTKGLISLGIHDSKSRHNKIAAFEHNSKEICINHYRFQSIEYLYGIKEQRGGGVNKEKYKQKKVLSPSLRSDSHIEDLWLKRNSSMIIKNCYDRDTPSPKTDLYKNSSWSKKLENIMALEKIV